MKFKKRTAALAVASCLSMTPWVAEAAGLGRLTVLSSLGQPLRAEMEIAASKDELAAMTARLAPVEVFKQAGVDYAASLNELRFTVEKRAKGKAVVKVSSSRPVNEPFLDFLVELNWPSGRLVREYTFLLDPPEMAQGKAVRSVADAKIVDTVRTTDKKPAVPASRPQVGPAVAPAVASVPEKAAKPEAKTEGTHVVERGETLRRIAANNRYAGVTLEQMLVGIYKHNRGAFLEGDINRIKTGAILNMPDKAAVEAVPENEARNIYITTGDFNAYRKKLAAAAAAAPAKAAPAPQATSGKIAPKVEETMPAVDAAKDQVKVGKADLAGQQASDADRLAKDKALLEAQQRVSMLEKNVDELQKLLELKNAKLAEMEKSREAPGTSVPPPVVAAPVEPVKPAEPPVAPAPVAAPAEAPAATPAPVEPPAAAPAPEPKAAPATDPDEDEVEEPGLLDTLLADPLPLAGGAALIALVAGGLMYRRRRAQSVAFETTAAPNPSSLGPNSVFQMTGGESVDTGHTLAQTGDFSQAGPGSIDTDEVDPVAEADVYMAYGRDAQAEEILLEAMQKDPQRLAIHAKLAEIYANRGSVKQFETLASELYAQTGGRGPEWTKVAALGAKLVPGNPLYSAITHVDTSVEAGETFQEAPTAFAPEPVPAPVEDVIPEPLVLDEPNHLADDAPLEFELPPVAFSPPEPVTDVVDEAPYVDTFVTAEPLPDDGEALDFDLASISSGVSSQVQAADFSTGSLTQQISLDDAPALPGDLDDEPLAMDELPEPAREFSPEGTLIVPTGLYDSAVAPQDLGSGDWSDQQEKTVVLSEESVADDFDNPELVSTVVNPVMADDESDSLDFDVKLSDSVFLGQPMAVPEFDMGSINLDLAAEPSATSGVEESAPDAELPADTSEVVRDANWEEVNTKLDLAKAYEDMGDLEGARELLEEVLADGSPDLVAQAESVLGRIGR
ncbi:MAG: hypothetical protein L6Q40_04960 [Azonexus sp.]|nr:hypothetical protein [Azonexus sp.]